MQTETIQLFTFASEVLATAVDPDVRRNDHVRRLVHSHVAIAGLLVKQDAGRGGSHDDS